MLVSITGGTGFVGKEVVSRLLEEGHQVRVLARHRPSERGREALSYFQGSVITGEGLDPFLRGSDAAIHLVGIIRESGDNTFEAVHHQGTRNVIEACDRAGVRRYLHMSALGTRAGAVSGYHRSKWAGEEAVKGSGLDWTIFRPSIVFGPGDAFVNMLADTLKKTPAMPMFGGGRNLMQPVSVRDVAMAFASALVKPGTVGKLYELAGPDRFEFRQILNIIANIIGKKRIFVPIPLFFARGPIALLQALGARLPITTDQLIMLQENNIRKGGDDISELGIEWTKFQEGIRNYLE